MSFLTTLSRGFLHVAKPSSPAPPILPLRSSPSFLPRRLQHHPALPPPLLGDRLIERILGLNRDFIRLKGPAPPPPPPPIMAERRISVDKIKKVLRASQMETARARLSAIQKSSIPYPEFVKICCDAVGGQAGLEIACSLDEAGAVIVLGDDAYLHPELVAKAIQSVIPLSSTNQIDPRRKELREMEEKKTVIDREADALVRRELWCGLLLVVVKMVGLIRLTFWDFSWNVMEPICFFLTSAYFIARYAFFLTSSKDPSFKGFFQSRLASKQKRLMKAHNFDLDRFNELRKA